MYAMKCPHNITHSCTDEDKPVFQDEESGQLDCKAGPCMYVMQLNNLLIIADKTGSIDDSIGISEEEATIADRLEQIEQQIDWLRQNVGATDEGETVYGAIQDLPLVDDIKSAVSDALEVTNDLLDSIKGYTSMY